MTKEVTRVIYSFPTNMRGELEQLVAQCVAENGGRAVGEPTIRLTNGGTVLEITEHPWWTELMKIRYQQLLLLGVNRFRQTTDKRSEGKG